MVSPRPIAARHVEVQQYKLCKHPLGWQFTFRDGRAGTVDFEPTVPNVIAELEVYTMPLEAPGISSDVDSARSKMLCWWQLT